jgi:hypothetical protein
VRSKKDERRYLSQRRGEIGHGPIVKTAGKLTQNDTEGCAQELMGPFKRETADVFVSCGF